MSHYFATVNKFLPLEVVMVILLVASSVVDAVKVNDNNDLINGASTVTEARNPLFGLSNLGLAGTGLARPGGFIGANGFGRPPYPVPINELDYQDGRRCPLCDSSVYSYCTDRLLHDACCCNPEDPTLPYQCRLADCSFLHANSCREHRLITRCCCNSLYLRNEP